MGELECACRDVWALGAQLGAPPAFLPQAPTLLASLSRCWRRGCWGGGVGGVGELRVG